MTSYAFIRGARDSGFPDVDCGARAFCGKVESEGIPKEARIRFKIPTGTRGPVMNGEAVLR
jgi:hypothetical protein